MKNALRLALCLAAALIALAACRREPLGPRTAGARVDYVNGEVTVDGVAVQAGASIKPVFTVKCGPASACGIVFDEKNIMHVDENTEAFVDLAADVRRVDLRRGMVGAALRKLSRVSSREQDKFRVGTPTAVAGVRGTVFLVKVEDETRSYLCDCNGVLHLSDASGGNARRVEAARHKAFRFSRAGTAFAVEAAQIEYHSDEMMEMGAARIGETIDWTRVGR